MEGFALEAGRLSLILISTGLWIDQSPGAESVGGVALVLTPGPQDWRMIELERPPWVPPDYGVDLLALFEHPVDTRQRSYEQAMMLALTDLPEAKGESEAPILFPPRQARTVELFAPGWISDPAPFQSPCQIWSRVRRYKPGVRVGPDGRLIRVAAPVRETILAFGPGCAEPELVQDGGDLDLAHAMGATLVLGL